MRKAIVALIAWVLLSAQTPMLPGFPPGTFQNRAAIDAAPPAAYQGPGNVVSGATAWWGLRAYSLAKAGTAAINLCDDTGANCSDVLTDGTTGRLANPGTHGVNDCSTSGTCRIATFYDQAGTNCAGVVACNVTQATNGSRAVLIWSCINTLPCARFSGGQSYTSTANVGATINQPYAFSATSTRTANFTTAQLILQVIAGSQLSFRALANAVAMFAGTGGQFIANISDSNWHAINSTYNGASSVLFCGGTAGTNCSAGGTSNPISPGANTLPSGNTYQLGHNSGANFLSGDIGEAGIWPLDFTASSRQTNMNANQIAFWGPF